MNSIESFVEKNYERYEEELFELLRIPSISPVPGFEKDILECAEAFSKLMNSAGIKTKVYQTNGNPIVYGETEYKEGRTTILFYGHYDVQPEGDVGLWDSPPYEPEVRNDRIYARGIGDNKGQIFSHIKGYEVYNKMFGKANINLKYILEGEEESGSEQLRAFSEDHKEMLKADVTIWSDANMHISGRPVIILGLKGISYLKINVKGPSRDIHSQFAAVLPNPIWKLITVLNSLKDKNGHVLVPGFYEDTEPPSNEVLQAIKRIPGKLTDYTDDWGVTETLSNNEIEDFYLRYMYEPTLNCGCISAGNPTSSKNVVPHEAAAWLDIRTVPNQKHTEICRKVKNFISSLEVPDIEVSCFGIDPAYTPLDNPFISTIIGVLQSVWKKEPIIFPALGGSGPFHVFNVVIGAPCIMVPFADSQQHDHGPNESMPIRNIKSGISTSAKLIQSLS